MGKAPATKSATAETDRSPFAFPFQPFPAGGEALEAWLEMNRSLLARFGDMQQQAARFLARRVEEDLGAQRDLAACRTPAEALEVFSAFTRKMIADYADEAGRLSDITGEMQSACSRFGGTVAGMPETGAIEAAPEQKAA